MNKTGIKNFLIGESLLKSDNPAELMKRFIQIINKIDLNLSCNLK